MGISITRRNLVAGAAGLALAGCSANVGKTKDISTDASAKNPVKSFDMHADTIDALGMTKRMPYASFDDKYSGSLASNNAQISADRMGGVQWVQCYAIWLPDDNGEGEFETDISHIEWYREGAKWFKEQMEQLKDQFQQVRNFADIPAILEAGKVAAILTVENAACLDAGLDVVDEFANDGVIIAGVTWNGRNVLGSGNTHPDEGLTKLGRQYIASLEEHGIVVDVSHLNKKGFWDVDKVATRPYIATHSNARAVCNHERNLTDDQFRALVSHGGVVGLNLHDAFVHEGGHVYSFDELAAHVEHWLDLGFEDAIALGSDRDGADIPTWIADCGSQGYLFERFRDRLGEKIARKLFFDNAMRFVESYSEA